MRRGFMHMFPDATVGNNGANQIVTHHEITSRRDADKNGTVEFKEVDNSIFTSQVNKINASITESNNAVLQSYADNAEGGNSIISNALQKFTGGADIKSKFDSVLKSKFQGVQGLERFDSKDGVVTSGEFKDKSVDFATMKIQDKLDAAVTNAATQAANDTNNTLMNSYLDALAKAKSDYDKEHAEGEEKPEHVGAKDVELNDLGKGQKATHTAFSTYDTSPQDGKVKTNEISNRMNYNNKAQVFSSAENIEKVEKSLGGKIANIGKGMFEKAIANFSADVGSIDIKQGKNTEKAEGKIKDAIDKLNTQAEKAADKAAAKANEQVYKAYQQQLNKTLADITNPGAQKPANTKSMAPKSPQTPAAANPQGGPNTPEAKPAEQKSDPGTGFKHNDWKTPSGNTGYDAKTTGDGGEKPVSGKFNIKDNLDGGVNWTTLGKSNKVDLNSKKSNNDGSETASLQNRLENAQFTNVKQVLTFMLEEIGLRPDDKSIDTDKLMKDLINNNPSVFLRKGSNAGQVRSDANFAKLDFPSAEMIKKHYHK